MFFSFLLTIPLLFFNGDRECFAFPLPKKKQKSLALDIRWSIRFLISKRNKTPPAFSGVKQHFFLQYFQIIDARLPHPMTIIKLRLPS